MIVVDRGVAIVIFMIVVGRGMAMVMGMIVVVVVFKNFVNECFITDRNYNPVMMMMRYECMGQDYHRSQQHK
jgi:hypothetical protein